MTGVQTCALPISAPELLKALTDTAECLAGWMEIAEENDRRDYDRSEERRVGKEGRARWSPDH